MTIKDQFEDIFDRDWRAYCNEIQARNRASNERLFRVLASYKGEGFRIGVKGLLWGRDGTLVQFTNKSEGFDFQVPGVGTAKIEQRSHPQGGMEVAITIPVKKGKWLLIEYIQS